jgi:hypothetical protein
MPKRVNIYPTGLIFKFSKHHLAGPNSVNTPSEVKLLHDRRDILRSRLNPVISFQLRCPRTLRVVAATTVTFFEAPISSGFAEEESALCVQLTLYRIGEKRAHFALLDICISLTRSVKLCQLSEEYAQRHLSIERVTKKYVPNSSRRRRWN